MTSRKDAKQLIRKLKTAGYDIRQTKSNHYTVTRDGKWVTGMGGSPGDSKFVLAVMAQVKRFERKEK